MASEPEKVTEPSCSGIVPSYWQIRKKHFRKLETRTASLMLIAGAYVTTLSILEWWRRCEQLSDDRGGRLNPARVCEIDQAVRQDSSGNGQAVAQIQAAQVAAEGPTLSLARCRRPRCEGTTV
jgi:hypothetical protein